MSGWKIVGISDECDYCEVCGRRELKRTVHLVMEDGSELRAGTTCAARKVGVKAKDMNEAVKAYAMKLECVRCDFPDHFRKLKGMTPEEFLRRYPRMRKHMEARFKLYVEHEMRERFGL